MIDFLVAMVKQDRIYTVESEISIISVDNGNMLNLSGSICTHFSYI